MKRWKKLMLLGLMLATVWISASAARNEWAFITYYFDDGSYAGVGIYPCEGRYTLKGTATQNYVVESGPCITPP